MFQTIQNTFIAYMNVWTLANKIKDVKRKPSTMGVYNPQKTLNPQNPHVSNHS
jgi:hypothetical protein